MAINAIVFDIGGVLAHDVWEPLVFGEVNSIATICNLDSKKTREVGQILWDEFAHRSANEEIGWQELELNYWEKFINKLKLQISTENLLAITEQYIKPVPGMLELVRQLHSRGLKLALCSNNTEFWYERQNKKLGLEYFFPKNNVILSSRVGISKESPNFEMFKATINALEVNKLSCLFIDDRQENIEISTRYGIPSILFPSHSEFGSQYLTNLLKEMKVI